MTSSWPPLCFGCKDNIACCLDLNLVALLQMKRGLLAYRYRGRPHTAHQLYALVQRRMRSLIVELGPRPPAWW